MLHLQVVSRSRNIAFDAYENCHHMQQKVSKCFPDTATLIPTVSLEFPTLFRRYVGSGSKYHFQTTSTCAADQTSHLQWRLLNGQLMALNPPKLVVMVRFQLMYLCASLMNKKSCW